MVALLLAIQLSLSASPPPKLPPEGVYALPDAQFAQQAERDLAALQRYANGLRRVQEQLRKNRPLFQQKPSQPYTPEQKRVLLSSWAAMFDYVLSCEVLRQRYWDFVKLPPAQKTKHAWGFLLTHGALTTELAHGLTFTDLAAGQKQLEVLLDEPSPEYGIPPHAFADFKGRIVGVPTAAQLMTGDAWGHQLLPLYRELGILDHPLVPWVLNEMKQNSKAARAKLLRRGVKLFVTNAVDIAGDTAAHALFPVQKGVAEWMGDTRVRRQGDPLITRAQALELVAKLQPGDILVARQNWFLSNIGLPGFWPHSELYLGTRDEFSRYFDEDAEVKAWLSTLPGKPESLSAYLAAEFPGKWREFGGMDPHGDPIRIMEAISEGVSFTGIEHGMRVDYLGAMRPRLTKVDKAKAMVRAFRYEGRPYDFNFDFLSDSTLVCSELVYKAYQPSPGLHGVKLPLVEVAGRLTLPPNDVVRLFDEEHDSPGRQLDFVAFLDGRENPKGAFFNTEDEFRKTYRRLKWDIAQK